MTLACLAIQKVPGWPTAPGRLTALIQLIALVAAGGAVYLAACAAMGVDTLRQLIKRR